MKSWLRVLLAAALPALVASPVELPAGAPGIGFDDLVFSPALHRVIVPAGRSGNLDLIDPVSTEVVSIGGFSSSATFAQGHGEGTTSADAGRGLIFATDRTARSLVVVDPAARRIITRTALSGGADYVRYLATTGEVWVTDPDAERIEIFTVPASGAPAPAHAGFIAVAGGPESLALDERRGRADTHLWKGSTVAIDIRTRKAVATWRNGCAGSRGIALDAAHGLLFAGCAEGRAVVLNLNADGAVVDSLDYGAGVDIIAWNPLLRHLYLPGARSATMAILGVSDAGRLSLLGAVETSIGSHCVVSDDRGQAWVCDPSRGRLLLVRDTL